MTYRELRVPREPGGLARVAREAAARLAAGEVLVHPTSTLYGLGAAAHPEGDAEIARLKGRDPDAPFIRLASSVEAVRDARPRSAWNDLAERLASAFWPGPLTLILDDGTAHGLAVRVDGHPVIGAVLAAYGGLISSTSVNRAGEPPATDPVRVREVLAGLPPSRRGATLLDAGRLAGSAPSTLVSLRGGEARLLREGAVPAERVEACLGTRLVRGKA